MLSCDVIDLIIRGVLYQKDEKREYRVIAYRNRILKGAERNCFMSEKETLAIVCCLNK